MSVAETLVTVSGVVPALAPADVEIATGTGTDVAIEASDVTLIPR